MQEIIFDLDGVIFTTAEANVIAFQYGFKAFGLSIPSGDRIKSLIGMPAIDMIVEMSDDQITLSEAKYMFEEYVKPKFLEIVPKTAKLYDGVQETLKELQSTYYLSVLTSGTREVQIPVLENLKIIRYFDKIVTQSDSNYKKPDSRFIQPLLDHRFEKIYFVDDSELGMVMAKQLGINSIFAEYGHGKLKCIEPDYIIKRFDDIKEIVKIDVDKSSSTN
jgi:HAD superfamily hydrolase (TIGR01509 family)